MGFCITTSDYAQSVSIGTYEFWDSVAKTVKDNLPAAADAAPRALAFFESCECAAGDALATAREFNLVHDMLAQVPPSKAAIEVDEISPVITSCANLFVTSEGADLFSALVGILVYAHYCKVDVQPL